MENKKLVGKKANIPKYNKKESKTQKTKTITINYNLNTKINKLIEYNLKTRKSSKQLIVECSW